MITLYNKDFTVNYGTINTTIEAFVEEERNGLFELSFIMLNTDSLFSYVKEENIVVANANDTLLDQKFRIYMTRKLMNNRVEVFARHISFDLMYDYIDNLSFTNQSCQYALNQLFINSSFSKHYKGYSDIVNAQDYKMSMANILEAIGGKKGSIIDTFGTGAEILRDNENIHVLNKRGYDNSVTIEYRKNLTGLELEEDTTDLVTRILPYAKYSPTDEEGNTLDEVTVKADFVDSPLINNYSHPYIKSIDYSEKFEDEEIPTVEKLIKLAQNEYENNKVDRLKQNFKIDFIPLSKCVGYEGLEDKISLCDTVTIIDTRYNINTQAKVIKTVFNVLKNRYESIELGEPKTTLGDIIGSGGDNEPVVGPPGPPGPPGEDGNLGDFPNSLPVTPVLEAFVYGFSNIELSWSFENKVYYQYELYASKVKDFNPNAFDLIFQGQASSYMFQAKPNETWYFKVCGINTYGERTEFSNQATVTTTKIEDLSNYVENMAINEALIGTLSLDRGWIGRLNANLLDVKGNFSVTDGNGKRTLDIDSFGNVNIDASSLKINSSDVGTMINGKVSFSDLSTSGSTTINGSNITTGTIDASKVTVTNLSVRGELISGQINGVGGVKFADGAVISSCDSHVPGYKGIGISAPSIKLGDYVDIVNPTLIGAVTGQANSTSSTTTWSMSGNGVLDCVSVVASDTISSKNSSIGNVVTNRIDVYGYSNLDGALYVSGNATVVGSLNVKNQAIYGMNNLALGRGTVYLPQGGGNNTIDYLRIGGGFMACADSGNFHFLTKNGVAATLYGARLEASGDVVCNSLWARSKVYANNVALTSDRNLKEGIRYIDVDEQIIDEKGLVNPNTNITTNDMHEFVENLPMASYRLKSDVENGEDYTHYGFIAQDILYTKVGSELIDIIPEEQREKDEEGNIIEDGLRFSENKFVAFICGALQKEIKLRKQLEERLSQIQMSLASLISEVSEK